VAERFELVGHASGAPLFVYPLLVVVVGAEVFEGSGEVGKEMEHNGRKWTIRMAPTALALGMRVDSTGKRPNVLAKRTLRRQSLGSPLTNLLLSRDICVPSAARAGNVGDIGAERTGPQCENRGTSSDLPT
jgi:hypothetical protein